VIPSLTKFLNKTIFLSYLALATVTPLLFSTQNSELFEVPKMLFVYLISTIIFFLTLIKFVLQNKITIPKSWPLLALFFFLIIQSLSTFTSIDKFTSVFGYPSRLNGSLLSQFAYFVIFAGALINLDLKQAQKILTSIVVGALAVSLWGIPGHFGKDPSCLILTGKITSDCWQQDFNPTIRIFSTLGQPNWLASFLIITLPLAIAFALGSKNGRLKLFFTATSLIIFTALVMTNSRAGILGLAIAFGIFFLVLGMKILKENSKIILALLAGLLILTFFFGDFLFARFLEGVKPKPNLQTPPSSTNSELQTTNSVPRGTESSEIRLIVWRGAYEIFKNWPILGSGPETFAYSYYRFRPEAHNSTTEWNFFYNKAHNELLNYLANTGTLGILAYAMLIAKIVYNLYQKSQQSKDQKAQLIAKGVLAGFVGYQTSIFFGFSTVASQLIMYLTIALALTEKKPSSRLEVKLPFKKPRTFLVWPLTLFALIAISIPIRIYLADIFYNQAQNLKSENPGHALLRFEAAIDAYPSKNPFYLMDYANTLATYSAGLEDTNLSTQFADLAAYTTTKVQALSPNNPIIERKISNTYLLISDFDEEYAENSLESAQKLTHLAPTDPQSYLTLAKIQAALLDQEEARRSLEKALSLKPDYVEAQELLEQLTIDQDSNEN